MERQNNRSNVKQKNGIFNFHTFKSLKPLVAGIFLFSPLSLEESNFLLFFDFSLVLQSFLSFPFSSMKSSKRKKKMRG